MAARRWAARLLLAAAGAGAVAAAATAGGSSSGSSAVAAAYGEAQVYVTGGPGTATSRVTAAYPAPAPGALTAAVGSVLHVVFAVTNAATGAGLTPHQAFVRLTHAESGVVTHFVAPPAPTLRAGAAGVHGWSVDLSDRKALAGAAAMGVYAVDIVVGDAGISNPVVWRVTNALTLQPAAAPVKPAPPLYTTPLLHESDTTLTPLRKIAHAFRTPEKRPPAVVSLAAAAAIVACLLAFVVAAFRVPGFGISVPPGAALWAGAFFLCFAAYIALFAAFWLSVNMFTTLTYAALLAAPTAFTCHRMLVALQAADAKTA